MFENCSARVRIPVAGGSPIGGGRKAPSRQTQRHMPCNAALFVLRAARRPGRRPTGLFRSEGSWWRSV